jgi:hypothetical protein
MLDFTRFEILTFDCYGTLIDWESGILTVLHRILAAHGKKIDDATLLKLYGDFEQRSNSVSIPQPTKSAHSPTPSPPGSPGPTPSPRFASSRPATDSPSSPT